MQASRGKKLGRASSCFWPFAFFVLSILCAIGTSQRLRPSIHRETQVNIHAPGVGVDVGNGGVSVGAPGTSVQVGRACDASDLEQARVVRDDETCQDVLPDYLDDTSNGNFEDMSEHGRTSAMDRLCTTSCGGKFTDYMTASQKQRGCGEAQQEQERREESGEEQEGDEERDPSQRLRLLDEEEEEGHDERGGFGGVTVRVGDTLNIYKPDSDFPGLLLGCQKDNAGGYCALKKGDPGDGDCDFFMSCCYGSYLAGQGQSDTIDWIEQKCPGSKAFANQTCGST